MASLRPRSVRERPEPKLTARSGERVPDRLQQSAVHPAIPSCLQTRRSGFHVILRVKMRPRWIGRAHRIDNRQMLRVEHRLQRGERRVQSEEAVQIHRRGGRAIGLRNRERRAKLVVARFAERNNHVQTIHCAALENRHQNLLPALAEASAAYTERDNQDGIAPTPKIASAESFMKTRRDVIVTFFENPVNRSPGRPPAPESFASRSFRALLMAERVCGRSAPDTSASSPPRQDCSRTAGRPPSRPQRHSWQAAARSSCD